MIFILLALSSYGQRASQLSIKNIKGGYGEDVLYLPFRYKGVAKMYINGIDKEANILFNYKLDHSPLELRPSDDQQYLYIAGGLKGKSALHRLDTLLNLEVVDKVEEITLDAHDFQFLPNGHLLMFAPTPDTLDLSKRVAGGQEAVKVIHFSIFEIDLTEQKVLHEWNSKDHFSILDGGEHLDLRAKSLDYCHFNSIQYLEKDGTVITSSRDMSEITKIKWPEGDVIWRMGGKNNVFEFVNDTIGFAGQHQARMHGDTLVLFDNGTFHDHKQSSVVMYRVDEEHKKVTLLHRFYGNDINFTKRRGGVSLLKNGNLLVSWGQNENLDHNFSELAASGETLQKGYFYNVQNYRVNKGTWQPKLLKIVLEEGVMKQLKVSNQSTYPLKITKIATNKGTVQLIRPLQLAPQESKWIGLSFEGEAILDSKGLKGSIEYEHEDLFFVNQVFNFF